jgi:TetR/AcrR family transcriptional regulator, repressor for neighboring sulfatase
MLETPDTRGGDSDDSRPNGRAEVVAAATRAAADLFAAKNPSHVSVREIAAHAGVSHALVHRYLGSKEDILRAVLALDRQEASDYWTHTHGLGVAGGTFEQDQPPGRYIRTVMRASLEGVTLEPDDIRMPHAETMLEFLETRGFPDVKNDPGFDVRLLFSAVTAMAAGMAVAEDFFLVQGGIEDEDREKVRAEINRLIMRIMTLADRPE